jgi:hypothetical protein
MFGCLCARAESRLEEVCEQLCRRPVTEVSSEDRKKDSRSTQDAKNKLLDD